MSSDAALNRTQIEADLAVDTFASQGIGVKRWNRRVAADLVAVADGATVFFGAALPALIYGSVGGIVTNWVLLAQSSMAAALIAHLCMRYWNQYDTAHMHNFPLNPGRIFMALVIGLMTVVGLGLPHALKNGHVWIWFITWLTASFTLMIFTRTICSLVLKKFTATGRFDQRVAVFGAGPIARRVHDYLMDPVLGLKFAGVYDDRNGEERLNPEGLVVNGRLNDLITAAQNDEIDQIVIALPQGAADRISLIARKLSKLPVSVHIVTHIASDLVEAGGFRHTVSNLGPVGLIDLKPKPLDGWSPIVKFAEDRILGTLLLFAAAPLFPLIAAAIKLDSKGPIFFYQSRRGLNQRTINVIKFRTMYVEDAAPGADVKQATKDDARVTPVGKFLRRFSLDEVPQLINVLLGEMSLVGPRPHALSHDEKFSEMLENYANRNQVKPGMTGLAQVRGFRGETTGQSAIEDRVNADIEYIRDWSLSLDLKILFRTVATVLTGKNAY